MGNWNKVYKPMWLHKVLKMLKILYAWIVIQNKVSIKQEQSYSVLAIKTVCRCLAQLIVPWKTNSRLELDLGITSARPLTLNQRSVFADKKVIICVLCFNPRTYTQIHTPTLVQGKGEGGGWSPSPEFLICCSISKRFCPQWKALDLLNKMSYILWVVALMETCDVTNNGRHLGFYQELEIRLKPRERVIFCALHEK